MRITFWGTRGSIAKPGPTTLRYGGNTSCVEILSRSGTRIVVDCGTGGHDLGQRLLASQGNTTRGHILISHSHWDHIQGIPFFAPLFSPGNEWDIYGPKGLAQGIQNTLAGQMEHTYFPITLAQFAATIRFHDLVEGGFSIDDVRISARYLNHPALTLGYRFEVDGASLVYCCDHEPYSAALGSGEAPIEGGDQRHSDFVRGADLVIHDAQYTASEYPARVGWGHSSGEYAERICRDAGVKKLALTHHDPLRDDDAIDRIVEAARRRLADQGSSLEVLAAAEGMTLDLQGRPETSPSPEQVRFQARTPVDVHSEARPVLLYTVDPKTTAVLSEAISLEGLPCRVLKDVGELLSRVIEDNPSMVLIEHRPPVLDGLLTVQTIREREGAERVQVPVVLVSTRDQQVKGWDGLATDWLVEPFSISYARTKIRSWVLRNTCRWVRARLPSNEARRLQALRDLAILDTPAEERFDRVTRLASATLNVPIALVSLVDQNRQWFKSCYGLDSNGATRDAAFCAHVVESGNELVVPDTLLDDRFADNPLVAGDPRIRFYAGAPLVLDDGSCIGTLCVIDIRPRAMGASDLAALRDLRDLVLQEIQRKEA
jgi:phosphoribosyl 1,2-cyclic phosphodiesterase/DNA-binding response OmpR family regulator